MAKKHFGGRIAIDVRDSKPDWAPYQPPQAPEGAPNLLFIVWDDVGFGASDDYRSPDTFTGGSIEKVTVSVKGARHTDPKMEAEMARRRD